jgi:peptide/nickel transport system permease protein
MIIMENAEITTFTTRKEFYKIYKKKSRGKEIWTQFARNKTAVFGLMLFILVILVAIFAPVIADYDAKAIKVDIPHRLKAPNATNILGTDEMGRDILARIVHGARISLIVGIAAVGVALVLGGTLGSIAGFYGGFLDNFIMRAMDVFLCLPEILLALAIVASFGTNLVNLTIAIGLSLTPKLSRIARAAVLSVRSNEYVEAARSIGAKNDRIITRHVLVNCLAPIIVQVTLNVANAILTIAALSFIGLGVQAPTPEWGNMLASGRAYMRDYPYLVMSPGLAIFFTILSLNLLGDGLRDALDPRLKQ